MSINMDSNEPTDYSSFSYQTVVTRNQVGDSESNESRIVLFEEEPLAGVGGLSNNEVAELVGYELIQSLEYESEVNQTDDSFTEQRGVFGANLAADEALLPATFRGNQNDGQIVSGSAGGQTILSGSQTDDRIFQMYRGSISQGYADATNGTGGAGSENRFHTFKNFRALTGRGPVLDSTDNVTVLDKVIAGDTNGPVEGNVRCHLIWDVAETDDAGRAFSVPM